MLPSWPGLSSSLKLRRPNTCSPAKLWRSRVPAIHASPRMSKNVDAGPSPRRSGFGGAGGTSPGRTNSQQLPYFLDLHLVRIEGEMARNLGHRGKGRLIGPDRVVQRLAVSLDTVIAGIALVGAMGDAVGALQQRHVGVLSRHILHRRIFRLFQRQRLGGLGDHDIAGRDPDAPGIWGDGDGVVGPWKLHDFTPFSITLPRAALCRGFIQIGSSI